MVDEKYGIGRIYRKSFCYDNLFGTLRHELDAAQRGIWNDLLDMAKLSRVRPGLIAPGLGSQYSHEWLSAFLNVPMELLEDTIKLLKETERINENGAGIEIINWHKYQTEYDRQKPYRQKKNDGVKNDPAKFKKGAYGHMVCTTREEVERRKASRSEE